MAPVSDPAGDVEEAALAAWRAEFARTSRLPLTAGIALAAMGVLAAILRGTAWPWLPRAVPIAIIATALGLMLIGSVRRIRYHLQRLRHLR